VTRIYEAHTALNEKLLKGVDTLADNVSATLGPRGRNVILQEVGKEPFVTKDGVTVAAFVELDDPIENLGASILRQATSATNHKAGDGTTTATVLARAIMKNSQKHLAAGASPIEMKRGMDKAVASVVASLRDSAIPIRRQEDIAHVATISANGDTQIGDLIANAVDQTGKDGAITIKEGRSLDTTLELIEGFQFNSGYVANAFVTDKRRAAVQYEDPLFLLVDRAIERVDEILPTLQVAARENRPLIIVAENIEGQALAALIMNSVRGTMKVAALKSPSYGEERRAILNDLALATGGTVVSMENNLKLADVQLTHLGSAKSVEAYKNWTTIVGGHGSFEEVTEHIEKLKAEIDHTDSLPDCETLQRRITRLASGVAIIHVGGATEVEMTEKKHRIEDALEAVRSAQEEGIVPGGGVALLRTLSTLDVECDNEDQERGAGVVVEALAAPLRQMASNAYASEDLVLQKVMLAAPNMGYNFATGEMVDMVESGIVDPAKVTRCALENAVSAAGTLIATNHAIVQID